MKIFKKINDNLEIFNLEYQRILNQRNQSESEKEMSMLEVVLSQNQNILLDWLTHNDPFTVNESGLNIFLMCVVTEDLPAIQLILDRVPTLLNSQDKHGLTALHHCATSDSKEIAEFLIKQKNIDLEMESLDFIDKTSGVPVGMCGGQTPLLLAAERGRADVFSVLYSAGANACTKDNNGSGVMSLSLFNGHLSIAEILGCQPPPHLPTKQRQLEWQTKYITQIRKRVQEKQRAELLTNLKTIQTNYTKIHPEVFTFTDHPEEVFHPEFLHIVDAARNHNLEEVLTRVNDIGHGVYLMPVFQPEFCQQLLQELDSCHTQSVEKNLPIRRPNVRNSNGVVLNDFGFRDSLYSMTHEYITPLANLLIPSEHDVRQPWGFQSNYTFSVAFKCGEDDELVTHKDSSDVTFNICLGYEGFAGANVYFYPRDTVTIEDAQMNDVVEGTHLVGYGMLHFGRQLHGTRRLTQGNRVNVVIWNRSWKNETIDE